MARPWFRMYSEAVDDEKLRLLAFEDRWHFVAVLCLKCQGSLDSDAPYLDRRVALKLGLQLPQLDELKRRLMEVGLISEDWQPLKWADRQFESDSSKDRMERYRDRRAANGLSRGDSDMNKLRQVVFSRDGGRCVYCESTESLCLDHMVPIQKGGTDEKDNLAVACKRCNSGKQGRTPQEAGYAFRSIQAKLAHESYLLRSVTVTVTAQDTEQIQNRTEQIRTVKAAAPPAWADEFKSIYPPRAGDPNWRGAWRAANARIAEGHTPEEFLAGARRYAEFCRATGKANTETVQQASRFLGPSKPFLLLWNLPASKAQQAQDANVTAAQEWLRQSGAE